MCGREGVHVHANLISEWLIYNMYCVIVLSIHVYVNIHVVHVHVRITPVYMHIHVHVYMDMKIERDKKTCFPTGI